MWEPGQLAYFAAILDGEGHISVEKQSADGKQRKHDYYTLRIVIANTSLDLMKWLVANFGGSYYSDKKKEGYKQMYRYRLFGEQLFQVALAIYPYMLIKKKHLDLVFEFRKTVGKTGWHVSKETLLERHRIYLAMKSINK